MNVENLHKQITAIIKNYALPLAVIADVNARLADSQDYGYVKQQLRYLQRVVSAFHSEVLA